ncbi:hypothetical protein AWH04_08570 [Rhodococcus erythropolis]|nr:hypothetical protein AWH04_08570 [Rhodococcus erythropolis]
MGEEMRGSDALVVVGCCLVLGAFGAFASLGVGGLRMSCAADSAVALGHSSSFLFAAQRGFRLAAKTGVAVQHESVTGGAREGPQKHLYGPESIGPGLVRLRVSGQSQFAG